MPEKIFAGSVIEKFNGDVLDVRLETAVLRQGVYTGQDRDGQPCKYVNVSVRKSRGGKWYVELDMYHASQPQQAAPPTPAPAPAPRGAPPPFPAAQPPAAAPAPAPEAQAADDPMPDVPF